MKEQFIPKTKWGNGFFTPEVASHVTLCKPWEQAFFQWKQLGMVPFLDVILAIIFL